jgi:hypothetical protein
MICSAWSNTVVINATDARRAAEFWGKALGYTPRSEGALDTEGNAFCVVNADDG